MSGVITSSSFAKLLFPGLNAIFGQSYADYPVEWTALFDVQKSDMAYEEDLGMSSFGLASIKTEGGPITYDSQRQGFTTRYSHVVYALGFIITREMYEDDQYGKVGGLKAKSLARSLRQTKETVSANIYNRAFNSSYTGGDGICLCSASHVNVSGGTYSNIIATAADLSEAALEQAVIDIAGYRDDRGLLIACKPKQLIIPYQLQFDAKRILDTKLRVDSAQNDINAINNMGLFKNVTICHYLTDADAWFIRTDVQDGMKCFERRGDQFEMENDFDTENAKYKASFRASWGWSDPRQIYGSAGA
jgi:hypothetical protein